MTIAVKVLRKIGRHQRIREKVKGTSDRPRVSVYRSHKHLCVQLINDLEGTTLLSVSTLEPDIRKKIPYGGNMASAKELGKILAERVIQKGIQQVVFDRGGYVYHGRIKALADVLRDKGVQL